MRRIPVVAAFLALALGLATAPRTLVSRTSTTTDFVHFESSHVHPIAMTPSGTRLLVVNTPDNRLSVFDLTGGLPVRVAEIPVGLEPVSVAARSDNEAWVVNQLSDDVSIVDLNTLHVRATLRVGDEPADVAFANGFAYVSVSQEDVVKVFNPATLAPAPTPVVAISGRMPRALAATSSGARVYVSVFNAGNRTSVLSAQEVGPGVPPLDPPLQSGLGPAPAPIALIVKQDNTGALNAPWRDELGRNWGPLGPTPNGPSPKIGYNLFDVDVAQVNTTTQAVADTFSDIGTINLGLAVSSNGTVAVTATEARNLRRLEPNLSGHLVDTRAAVISPAGVVTPIELNKDIQYGTTPGPASDLTLAIGIPTGVAWAADNSTFYVTALANDRLARLNSAGAILARAPTVAGPTGVVVDDARGRIYVVGRFRNQLQTLSESTLGSLAITSIGMDPTPDAIVNGRKFFYGGFTSGHGDQACASCHVFGDFDNIAWDLGNPLADSITINTAGQILPVDPKVHPVKGPMVTQSLRGLPNTGMLHWRADRNNLAAFNPAFVGLMGRAAQLPDSEMAAFSDFVLPLVYPPNPRQNLDRSFPDAPRHTPSAQRGRTFYFNRPVDGGTCNTCHAALDFGPGTNGQIINNQALLEAQDMKIPQLRNMYKKTGFTDLPGALNKRGFGFTHDGAVDNLFDFLLFPGFNFTDPPGTIDPQTPDENRRDVEPFLLAFDTGMAPAVGFQITFSGPNNNAAPLLAQLQTLRDQFDSTYIDLVAKGRIVDVQHPAGVPRGWLYVGGDQWQPDVTGPTISSAALRALGGLGTEVTVTGVPRGSGQRIGIDRDRDTYLDGDELAARSDPGNPASTPLNVGVPGGPGEKGDPRAVRPNPFRSATEATFTLSHASRVECAIHDLLGREIRVLARGLSLDPGAHALRWDGRRDDGREAPAGVYFVRVRTAEGEWSRTVVRIR